MITRALIFERNDDSSDAAIFWLLDNAGFANFGTGSVDMSAIEYYSIFIYFIVSSVYLNGTQSLYVSSEVPTRLRRLE
jgi:hypothetical protein